MSEYEQEAFEIAPNHRLGFEWDLALAIALVSRWLCAAIACAKCVGQSEENLLKKAKGWPLSYCQPSLKVCVFCQPFCESRTCPRGESVFEKCLPLFVRLFLAKHYRKFQFFSGSVDVIHLTLVLFNMLEIELKLN